jgi:hypothetical protein
VPLEFASVDCKFGELTFEGGVEGDDDVGLGYAAIDEFVGNAPFSAVMLNPDFFVNNVKVQATAINALFVAAEVNEELGDIHAEWAGPFLGSRDRSSRNLQNLFKFFV